MDRPEMFEKFIDALSASDVSGKLKVMLLKKGIDMIQSAECMQYLQRLDDLKKNPNDPKRFIWYYVKKKYQSN